MHHVLLVDDDEAFREAATKALQTAGFSVTAATDHRRALEILEGDGPVDLLLTDIVMPGHIHGFALARMARLRRREIKIIYLTGYEIPGADDEALGLVLRKPIELPELIDQVNRMLSG